MFLICLGDMALLQVLHRMAEKLKQAPIDHFKRSVYDALTWGFFHQDIKSKPALTDSWTTAWDRLARLRNFKRWEKFLKRNGLEILTRAAEKNADPNFILSLFVHYLWDPNKARQSNFYRQRLDHLRAVYMARHLYRWTNQDEQARQEIVEESLWKVQEQMELELRTAGYEVPKPVYVNGVITAPLIEISFLPKPGKRSPDEKVNRTIFILFEHMQHVSKSPHWSDSLQILHAAEAITVASFDSPDRRILPHIKTFEKHHPEEAARIRAQIHDLDTILVELGALRVEK